MTKEDKMEKATFGAGCFWCVEAVFQRLKGVAQVESAYTGGHVPDPSYEQICSGTTGHAEVIQVTFNPDIISFEELLEVFWKTHDPTTLNRQGADVGTQYRSVVFYHNQEQQQIAERYKKELDESGIWKDPVVTQISPLQEYYPAENYHQDYYNQHQQAPYCSYVIKPKLSKLRQDFADKLR